MKFRFRWGKVILAGVMSLFLTACSIPYVDEGIEFLRQYLGPEYHERKAEESAQAAAEASRQAAAAQEQTDEEDEVEVATDVEFYPWEAEDGKMSKDIIGTITILADTMEIHQYGGVDSVVVKIATKGETYLCSQIYMDGSGNKWYCVGYNMWLLVDDMDFIAYEEVTSTSAGDQG